MSKQIAIFFIQNATQKLQKIFVHVPSEILACEVEEIGVEHLLGDVKDTTISTLATEVMSKLAALKGLDPRLREIRSYLEVVIDGKLTLNHEILYHLQVLIEFFVFVVGKMLQVSKSTKKKKK